MRIKAAPIPLRAAGRDGSTALQRIDGAGSTKLSLLIGYDIADPISSSLPHQSFLVLVRRGSEQRMSSS